MSQVDSFSVELRDKTGGSTGQALRENGMIPSVLYGADKENVNLSIDPRAILKAMDFVNFYTTVFELDIEGKKDRAMVREVQFHPVTDEPLHVDFMRITPGKKIRMNIPIVFINHDKSPGIKRGGLLNVVSHSLDVICQTDNIPAQITVDLAGQQVGTSIKTGTLELGEGVRTFNPDPRQTIATLVAPKVKGGAAAQAASEAADAKAKE